jgi:hypothetical protein
MRITTIILILLCLFASATRADTGNTDGWVVSREAHSPTEITTWKKSLPGKSLDAFRGEVTVSHSLLTVLAVLADIPNFSHWVFQCDSASLMPTLGPNIAYIYIDGIWPVSDRDAVVRSTMNQNTVTLAITIHSVAAPSLLPQKKGVVRMPALDNTFILTPLTPGKTHITFITYADPGGLIPAWLANFVAVRAPYVTLDNMEKRMDLPQYQITRLDQLPKILPGADQIRLPH